MWPLSSRVQQICLFLEKEEYRPCDGCKIEIYNTFTKYAFWFFEPFLRVWLQSFKKVQIWPKIIFLKKINKYIKKRRISRWFWIRWKSCKIVHLKQVISKTSLTNMSKNEKGAYFRHVFGAFFQNFFNGFEISLKFCVFWYPYWIF